MRGCVVDGCSSIHYALGLCAKHWARARKGQSLGEKSVYEQTPCERFEKKYRVAESGCWEWKFPRPDGRANTFWLDGSVQAAHVASHKIHKGPVNGLCVLHICDNGLCVNPDHLFLGTYADNTADMMEKGRANTARGIQKVHIAKLTEENVREIKASTLNGNQLAKKFGVHRRTVYDVLDGKTWRHIK